MAQIKSDKEPSGKMKPDLKEKSKIQVLENLIKRIPALLQTRVEKKPPVEARHK